MDTLRN